MNGTYLVLAVFAVFLALVGGAILVAAAWFFLSLKRSIDAMNAALAQFVAGYEEIKRGLAAVGIIAERLPLIQGSVEATAKAFGIFAEFAIGKQPPPSSPLPPPGISPLPNAPIPQGSAVGTGEFIPPRPEAEVLDEAMKQMLREQGVELDPSRIDEPSPDQIVQG